MADNHSQLNWHILNIAGNELNALTFGLNNEMKCNEMERSDSAESMELRSHV